MTEKQKETIKKLRNEIKRIIELSKEFNSIKPKWLRKELRKLV